MQGTDTNRTGGYVRVRSGAPLLCALTALLLVIGPAAPASAAPGCGGWLAGGFWEAAGTADVERCLSEGRSAAEWDGYGRTPPHLAVAFGTPELVRALMAAGADVGARDKHDSTPLHWAARAGTPETVRALLDAGADPAARAEDGVLPADLAEKNGRVRDDHVFWELNDARYRRRSHLAQCTPACK